MVCSHDATDQRLDTAHLLLMLWSQVDHAALVLGAAHFAISNTTHTPKFCTANIQHLVRSSSCGSLPGCCTTTCRNVTCCSCTADATWALQGTSHSSLDCQVRSSLLLNAHCKASTVTVCMANMHCQCTSRQHSVLITVLISFTNEVAAHCSTNSASITWQVHCLSQACNWCHMLLGFCHCQSNKGFRCLAGTGKTALSADAARPLIGDDEHCWGPSGEHTALM
jgi:hypothetical protein